VNSFREHQSYEQAAGAQLAAGCWSEFRGMRAQSGIFGYSFV
jgi:hypothetical protein